ncbi:hypothetical protein KI387_021958, partial [Taxus chinensis]
MDVKTVNILLDSNLNGKLIDFGLSKVRMDEETSQVLTAVRGTVGYMDPKFLVKLGTGNETVAEAAERESNELKISGNGMETS